MNAQQNYYFITLKFDILCFAAIKSSKNVNMSKCCHLQSIHHQVHRHSSFFAFCASPDHTVPSNF